MAKFKPGDIVRIRPGGNRSQEWTTAILSIASMKSVGEGYYDVYKSSYQGPEKQFHSSIQLNGVTGIDHYGEKIGELSEEGFNLLLLQVYGK
jgi:V8-like Glu-specific endopeptidase